MALKVYNLRCAHEHAFEGWFTSENDYDTQHERGLLVCPLCGSAEIERRPTAPRINLGAAESAPVSPPATKQAAVMPTPDMQAMFMRALREVAARTEDVGDRFAEEARRIHYEEVPARGIRGVTTAHEAQALADEGIRVMPLPFADLVKEPLQ